jgi:hypothetical protein
MCAASRPATFKEALAAPLGKDAPNLSPAVIARLKGQWQADPGVCIWADGVYLQARIEPRAECMLVLIGATPEGRKGSRLTRWWKLPQVRDGHGSGGQWWDLGRLRVEHRRCELGHGFELHVAVLKLPFVVGLQDHGKNSCHEFTQGRLIGG